MKTFALLGAALLAGALAGVVLDVATFLVARYGPQADGWSFRGNGALAVPFLLGPTILAAAWTALVARYRGLSRWLLWSFAAGLIGVAFFVVSVLALVLFNSSGAGVSNAMSIVVLGWMVVAPWLARFLQARPEHARRGQLGGHVMAGVAFVVTFFVALGVSTLGLAPGS